MSEQQGLSECCTTGHLHEGTPEGKVEEIAGMKAYVVGESKEKTLLYITDIFGYELNNARLLADEYAKGIGFRVVMPDFFDGDYVPHTLLKSIAPQKSDPEPGVLEKATETAKVGASLGPWLAKHREAVSRPKVEAAAKALLEDEGVKRVGVVGFCWGARYACLLGHTGKQPHVDCIVANHPSFLVVPTETDPIDVPTQVNVGDEDPMLPIEQVQQVKTSLARSALEFEVNIFPGATHGFAVRGDQNKDEEKKWKDQAAHNAIRWFKDNL